MSASASKGDNFSPPSNNDLEPIIQPQNQHNEKQHESEIIQSEQCGTSATNHESPHVVLNVVSPSPTLPSTSISSFSVSTCTPEIVTSLDPPPQHIASLSSTDKSKHKQQSLPPSSTSSSNQEFHSFILHEHFGELLSLVFKIKVLRNAFFANKKRPLKEVLVFDNIGGSTIDDTVWFIRSQYIPPKCLNKQHTKRGKKGNRKANFEHWIVKVGTCPKTDSLMKESINCLKNVLDRTIELYNKFDPTKHKVPSSSSSIGEGSVVGTTNCAVVDSKNGSRPKPMQYTQEQLHLLHAWMIENKSRPYPKHDEMTGLSVATGLTYSQVLNWATNVRKRHLRATIYGEKEPNQFLDFLFLANHRDELKASSEGRDEYDSIASKGGKRKRSNEDDYGVSNSKMMKMEHKVENGVSVAPSSKSIEHLSYETDQVLSNGSPTIQKSARGLSGLKRYYQKSNDILSPQSYEPSQKRQKLIGQSNPCLTGDDFQSRPTTPPNRISLYPHDAPNRIVISPIQIGGGNSPASTPSSDAISQHHPVCLFNRDEQPTDQKKTDVIGQYTEEGALSTNVSEEGDGKDRKDEDLDIDVALLDEMFPGTYSNDLFTTNDWNAFVDQNFGTDDKIEQETTNPDSTVPNKHPKKKKTHSLQGSDVSDILAKLPFDEAGFDIDDFFK